MSAQFSTLLDFYEGLFPNKASLKGNLQQAIKSRAMLIFMLSSQVQLMEGEAPKLKEYLISCCDHITDHP